jgi:hypothetical protein
MSNVVSLWYLAAFSAAGSYVARRNPVTGRVDGLAPLLPARGLQGSGHQQARAGS